MHKDLTKQIVYLNGKFLPIERAKISVLDRGFLFGDGVYEVICVYSGKPFRLTKHLTRLQASLDAIKLPFVVDHEEFTKIFTRLLVKNHVARGDYSIYVQITRGAASTRIRSFSEKITPTIFVLTKKIKPISVQELRKGKKAITLPDIRWQYCYIKTISSLPSILLFQEAFEQGCADAILIRNGYVLEGTSSNVFIVKKAKIITPPLSKNNLSGVTREIILQLARERGLDLKEKKIKLTELNIADEIWISSSTRGIFPIVKLNGKPVGKGKVGPIWRKMINLYFDYKRKYL